MLGLDIEVAIGDTRNVLISTSLSPGAVIEL
jgi:hypothetical protein